ncbi:MAG: hypothetical protein NVS9B7_02200 [Flavisolibacter sp.]
MARIKIDLPEHMNYAVTIPIRITDLNYGGHVGNDKILLLIHESRIQFLASLGYSEVSFEGTSLIMGDVGIEFKREIFYADQIKIYIGAKDISRVSFDLYYKLVKNQGQVAALAKTGMVCYNYQQKKVVTIPQNAVNKIKNL